MYVAVRDGLENVVAAVQKKACDAASGTLGVLFIASWRAGESSTNL